MTVEGCAIAIGDISPQSSALPRSLEAVSGSRPAALHFAVALWALREPLKAVTSTTLWHRAEGPRLLLVRLQRWFGNPSFHHGGVARGSFPSAAAQPSHGQARLCRG